MAEMMDCLVNYFSLEVNDEGMPRRYYSYHVVGGPGPTANGGVATIATVAAYNEDHVCDSCQTFFAAKAGGPMEAIAKALRYLDAYHEQDRLRKVGTDIRCMACL
jgi:hypothetical protein